MTVAPVSPGFPTTVEALRLREGQLGPGRPALVMARSSADDFTLVVEDRADVHVTSQDGRFSLGWLPLGRPGTGGEGWKIAVAGTAEARGHPVSFATKTPAGIGAAAVARVLETSRRA